MTSDGALKTGIGPAQAPDAIDSFVAMAHVDTRIPPALIRLGDRFALAAVRQGQAMQTELVLFDGQGTVARRMDVSAPAMGTAAPTFASHGNAVELLAIDAHAGFSPLLAFELSSEGVLGSPRIGRPISQPASPPMLAAARVGEDLFVGFTAIGMAATSAVGWMRFEDSGAPRALVRGTAYGPLSVSAAAIGNAAVFVADAPKDPGSNDGPRELHVRVTDRNDIGETLVIRGPDGTAQHGAIAAFSNGVAGVVFSANEGVYGALIRCAPAR